MFGILALILAISLSAQAQIAPGPPAVLNTNATSDTGTDLVPQVTTDGVGNWVAVWFSDEDLGGTAGTDQDIFVATFVFPSGGGGGGGCFIASATYGTPMAGEIDALRAVRDAYLLDSVFGSAFVDTYYRMSPPIADAVSRSPVLQSLVRIVLTPIVIVSKGILATPGLILSALILILTLFMTLYAFPRRSVGTITTVER